MKNRNFALASLLAAGFLLVIAFQNFSDPVRDLASVQDIRDIAPARPAGFLEPSPSFQAPEGATTPEAIATRWLERESRPLLAPLEKEWLTAVNGKINRFFRFEPVKGEEWPDPGSEDGAGSDSEDGSRSPGSDSPPGMPKIRTLPDGSPDPDSFKDMFSFERYVPRGIHLTKPNEVRLGFGQDTDLTCELQGSQQKFMISKNVTANSSLNVSHETGVNKNSMHFSLSW